MTDTATKPRCSNSDCSSTEAGGLTMVFTPGQGEAFSLLPRYTCDKCHAMMTFGMPRFYSGPRNARARVSYSAELEGWEIKGSHIVVAGKRQALRVAASLNRMGF